MVWRSPFLRLGGVVSMEQSMGKGVGGLGLSHYPMVPLHTK